MTGPTIRPIEMSTRSAGLLWRFAKTQTRRLPTSPLAKAQIGDLLYVREPFHARRNFDESPPRDIPNGSIIHAAEWDKMETAAAREYGRVRPARFMPRRASRLTLTLTDIRTEPLQAITETDAQAEGCAPATFTTTRPRRCQYRDWWDRLHPKTPWTDNPEVLVLSFTVRRDGIAEIERIQSRRAAATEGK